MPLQLNGVELLALCGALNEVAHGLRDNDLPVSLQARREEAGALLQRTPSLSEPLEEARYDIDLTASEAELCAACIDAAMQAIGEWEFQTRVGVSHQEALAAGQRLRAFAQVDAER
jgi:hypothetical protein